MSRLSCLLVVLAVCICVVAASPLGGKKRVINVNNVNSVSLEESHLVMHKMAVNETTAGSSKDTPCYPIPYNFCVGCAFGCSDTCFYTGTYDACVRSCMSYPGWAPNTQVTITYFPYGQWSTGGCICHGYKCA